jgi:hypothetical protein
MTRWAKRNAILFIVITILGVGAVLATQRVKASVWPPVDPAADILMADLSAVLAEDREAAYFQMTSGDPWQAMAIAVISLRAIPNDDPTLLDDALADEAAATFHLAVFGMKDLFDDETRELFMANVLDPETYPTDALVRLYYEVSTAPTLDETYVLIDELWALADSMNPVARAGALSMLASPWCFKYYPHRPEARQRLIAEYPDLDMTRAILQMSIVQCRHKHETVPEAMAKVFNRELTSDADRWVLNTDPVALLAAEALPNLLTEDAATQEDGVAVLCSGVTGSDDWHVRFGCLNLLPPHHAGGHKAIIEANVAALAASDFDTPDVTRATCMMVGFSIDAKDIETAAYWADELLAKERIVDPFERPLHEEAWMTVEHYGEYLASQGHFEEAALACEQLASKYPNSALAQRFLSKADQMRGK